MNRKTFAIAALTLTHAAVLISLFASAKELPPKVASHFNAAGVPDGWMSRDSYLWTMGAVAFGLTAFLLVIFYTLRYFPDGAINLPDRDYWLAPERRDETYAYLFRASLWLCAFQATLLLGVHQLVVAAHAAQPVQLSSRVWLLLGAFLLAIILWSIALICRFRRPSPLAA